MDCNTIKILLSDYLKVSNEEFLRLGVFNSNTLEDEKLFIDPSLLSSCMDKEFRNGIDIITEYFQRVILLIESKLEYKQDTPEYKEFEDYVVDTLNFQETKGLNLGYGTSNSSGKGIGIGKARVIEKALTNFVKRDIRTSKLFYLIPILSDKPIGADNISDMIIQIIRPQIYQYTERMLKELKIPEENKKRFSCNNIWYNLVPYPNDSRSPLLLVPSTVLSRLPIMDAYNKYIYYTDNDEIRKFLDSEIIQKLSLPSNTKPSKSDVKQVIQNALFSGDQNSVNCLIEAIEGTKAKHYDPEGINKMLDIIKSLDLLSISTTQNVRDIIKQVLDSFNDFVKNDTNKILKTLGALTCKLKETQMQTILYAYIKNTCLQNNIDISIEPESGGGKIDVKASRGLDKIVIEIKLSTHSDLVAHYDNQLIAYQSSENAYGFMLFLMLIMVMIWKSNNYKQLQHMKIENI